MKGGAQKDAEKQLEGRVGFGVRRKGCEIK